MDENKSANELNEALKGMWDSLTDEQKEKAKACKSMDELTVLAGKLGVELPDEMLDAVAGGATRIMPNNKRYCLYCKKAHYFMTKQIAMITPAGESGKLAVDVSHCEDTGRTFYYSMERNTYYDDNYCPVTVSSGGC